MFTDLDQYLLFTSNRYLYIQSYFVRFDLGNVYRETKRRGRLPLLRYYSAALPLKNFDLLLFGDACINILHVCTVLCVTKLLTI